MKMLSFKRSTLFLLIIYIFISFLGSNLEAQTISDNEIVLELEKGNKIKEVKNGKKVRIWIEGEKYKGRLDSITAKTIFVDNHELKIDKIEKIGIKFRATQITGAILGTSGLLISSLGGLLIYQAYQENSLGAVFLIVVGVVVEAVGLPVLAIGSSIFFIGKKYRKDKAWSFKAVQIN